MSPTRIRMTSKPLDGGVEQQFLKQEHVFNSVVAEVEKRLLRKGRDLENMDATTFKLAFSIGTFCGIFCTVCIILLIRSYRYRKKRYRG